MPADMHMQPGAKRTEFLDTAINNMGMYGNLAYGPTSTGDVLHALFALGADAGRGREVAIRDEGFVGMMEGLMEGLDRVKLTCTSSEDRAELMHRIMQKLSTRLITEVSPHFFS